MITSNLFSLTEHGFFTKEESPEDILKLDQVHGTKVLTVTDKWSDPPQADGMATNKSDIWLGIYTADCAPVLFSTKDGKIIGAAHAGWKGALNGILQNTIEKMEKLGAQKEEILAVIGPAIQQKSYEVTEEFKQPFLEQSPENELFFTENEKGNFQFDLPGYCAEQIRSTGVGNIEIIPHDTYAEKELFYSYRRGTHENRIEENRQISAIKITKE